MAKATLTTRVTALEDCYKKVGVNVESLQKTVVGNGKKGLTADVSEIKESVTFIRGQLDVLGHGPGKKTVTLRRLAETGVTVAILAVVLGGIVLFILGRLSIDDIVRILAARAGG